MRLVLLNDDAVPTARGGAAVVVDRLRKGYAKAGHEVTLITTHQNGSPRQETSDSAGNVISIPIQEDTKNRHRLCIHNPHAKEQLSALLRELKPEAVHAHNLHTYLTYESVLLAKEHTDRILLTAHDTFLVSFGRVRENRKLSLIDHLKAVGRKSSLQRNRMIREILSESGTKVIAISTILAEFLSKNGIDVHSVIHNGIEEIADAPITDCERFRAKHGLSGPTILFGGRISGDKGIGVLLQAFARVRETLPDAQLIIAGDRERADPYVQHQDGVVVLGHLSQEEMPLAYAAVDVVTTPSIYLDPFNLINIEAMAAEKPVVGTCFGGTPEIVVDGETGFIVDPRNTDAFAKALITVLSDFHRARRMGAAGQERVNKHFSLQKQIDAYQEILAN